MAVTQSNDGTVYYDNESVFPADIDADHVTQVGWSGEIKDLFDCPSHSAGLINSSVTNPKVIYIPFHRTLYCNAIGIGCNISGRYFSNIKLEFIGSDGTVRAIKDDSANNTNYGTNLYSVAPVACIAIKVSVCTADTDVGITSITIRKERIVTATIRGIDEDTGVPAYIATSGGDFNVLARLRNATGNTKINPATSDNQTLLLNELKLKADLTETQPVSATSWPLPTGASTLAAQGQFRDTNGTLTGWKTADGKPRVSSTEYLYDIGEGTVSGHSIFDKFGINEDVDSAAEEDIWINGGSYVWPAAEQAMDVVSSSAQDTATTGTGAWTVRIYYLNSSFVGKSIDVTLAGLTPVATSTSDIYRINRVRVLTAGTGLKAAGNIDVKATAPTATVYARVSTGQTMTRQCFHTVQADRLVYITQMTVSIGGTTAPKFGRFILRSNYDFQSAVLRGVFYPFAEIGVNSGALEKNFQVPLKFPAGADIIVSCKTVDNDCNTIATLRGWQETV